MKIKLFFWSFVFWSCGVVMAQNNVLKHKVAKGETITKIAQKYAVTPLDIYKLNPDAQAGVSENTILIIPVKGNTSVPKKITSKIVTHTVAAKETLYSIAQFYDCTIADIESNNPEVKNGLPIGLQLKIPVKNGWTAPQESIQHVVKPQETKYGIAKQYGITVEELERNNPEIIGKELPLGFTLIIKGQKGPKKEIEMPKPTVVSPKALENVSKEYVVKPQETLYGLANQFGCTQDELLALNPELKDGVREGMLLKIPAKKVVSLVKEYVDLTKSIQKQGTKKLALLLPFNISKLDQDTINSTKSRLKKDKFLNMTLDFYSGALMAVDSIRKMGIDVDVTILDSEETKSTSNVANLIRSNNLKSFQAVIGPFYQNNVEKAAELLETVPVFSPLSKDYDKKYPNLIQATTSNDAIKNAMFAYIAQKSGNCIAIIDPKKQATKQFIADQHPEVPIVNFNDKGVLDIAQLKSLLVAGKENFVIMETEKTNLILSVTSNLQTLQKLYDIKLVILGENDALDYEEIPMNRLTKLKMHYPSSYRVNDTPEAAIFDQNYKKKNKIFPNNFAIRGFDITFDVLLRLVQEKPILETLSEKASQQMESRFQYVANPEGGYTNNGVFILYYDTDLTIKQAN